MRKLSGLQYDTAPQKPSGFSSNRRKWEAPAICRGFLASVMVPEN